MAAAEDAAPVLKEGPGERPVPSVPPDPKEQEPEPGGGIPGAAPPQARPRSSSIVVSPRQRGNPVLRFIRNVPWEYGDVVADYVLGQSSCALFLSLRYHHLHPDYIHQRLRELGRGFVLRVLLLQVDVKDPQRALKDLAKICVLSDCTLLLAWSVRVPLTPMWGPHRSHCEGPTAPLWGSPHPLCVGPFAPQMSDCLTSIRAVNRTDALSLLSTFGSLAAMAAATKEDLSLCPGVGPQKAKRLFDVLHEPFLQTPK
ncbi:DNA excision repair protein ERCC-1 [Pezoporus occidentalis]|uniref:DNA excision repair protein ERCC-1 n=1 Tax=Pezoporus occidentalis TaxID=407982 RepID=UPI002F910503